MALTKITTNVIADSAITTNKISNTVTLGGPKIANVQYADASFTVLNDTAANTAGTARLIINGEGFNSGATVIVGTTAATSTTRVSATQLRANVTALSSGSYTMYVQNTDGGTAIRVNGVTFSNTPIWGTAAALSNQSANTAFAVNLSANSDSSVTYSNTSALPAGTSLLANGLFYGTVTIGAETTYNFTVEANDVENQEVPRTFSLTVTVTPQYQLWTWGQNNRGQLGLGDALKRSSPTQVGSDTTWNLVTSSRFYNTAAIKTDGTLWTWGANEDAALGLNDTISRSSPVQVGSGTTWNLVTSSRDTSAATKTDGTLWLWGRNNYGQLGLGNTIDRSSPTQVGSGTTWNKINAGIDTFMATKTDGTLWLWGRNNHGQLGFNDIVNRSSPVQIGSATTWNLVSIGKYNAIATKTDGTLWTWGANESAALGLNDTISRSSPVQIGSATTWNLVSVGRYNAIATKTDGTLWTWGYNLFGELGLGDRVYRSSPTQIGSSTNWNLISTSFYVSIATKTDGTLWLWGRNNHGQLGFNDIVNRSSPVQIGSATTWNKISSGLHITAIKTA